MTGLIFVVEGQGCNRRLIRQCLEQAGYAVRMGSAEEAVSEAQEYRPSLILIATGLPNGEGVGLCRQFRQSPLLEHTPLLLLMSGEAEEGRVVGLESGADDCLASPFSPRELVARVQAVLRRLAQARPTASFEQADILIDNAAMKISVRGTEIETTTLEFRLVDYLARHRGHVFTRDVLLDAVWGDTQFVTPRSVDACIRRLRDKIEPNRSNPTLLTTVRGVGYRFEGVATWPQSTSVCDCLACTPRPDRTRVPHFAMRRGTGAPPRGRPSL